jgi:zinc protease
MSRRLLALLALGLTVGAAPLFAQGGSTPPPSAAELAQKLAFDPSVTVGTLDNGLKYYIMVNKFPEKRAELRLGVSSGAIFEANDQIGLAHMTEHMAFNGTTHFPKNDLVHYLQSIGMRFGADVNAYTNADETVYMLQVPTDSGGKFLNTGIEILADWAYGQTFDSAEVEGERGVVSEEWRLGRGAFARMRNQQTPVIFKGSKYAERDVIGSIDYLKTFPQAALRRFYHDWYRPDLMAVVAVGDFDKDQVERQIRAQFSGIPKLAAMTRPVFPVPPHDSVYVTVATDREAPNSSFAIYNILPRRDQSTMGAFRARFVERLGLAMLSARYQEIAQQADAPFAFAGGGRGYFVHSADAFTLQAGVKDGGILRGLDAVLTETERASRFGFTATELDRAKSAQQRGQDQLYAQRDKQSSGTRAAELLRNFLQDEDVLGTVGEYEMYNRLRPTVTLDEVNRVTHDLFAGTNQVITVNAPEKAGVVVPTEAQLLATYKAVKAKTLEPYKDIVVTGPLVAKIPAPGAIVSEHTTPELGLTEWKLANGVRVVLKPTDFMADQILLSGSSPGGMSLVPDSLIMSGTFAATLAQQGGIGAYSAIDLNKLLTGKTAFASTGIGARTQTVNGQASRKDAETMFQLVYLRFMPPRKDSSAFLAFRQSMQASMSNSVASPQGAFFDTVSVTMSQHSVRARPIGPETLNEINLNRALAIYQDRFADASEFTFFIVGSFNIDTIKPLVQRYLGGLPSLNRNEVAKDVGIRPPTGVVEKTVRRGVEPQSQTFMAFTGPYQYSPANAYLMASLGEILTNRLIDHLREKLGGTYSVNARISGSREDKLYTATVQFGSAPERADELTRAVFAEVKDLMDAGPTAAELVKVKEAQLRARETNLKLNQFWTAQLSSAYQYGDDPRDILAYNKMVDGLTAGALQDAARRFLKGENYVHVTLLPETKVP